MQMSLILPSSRLILGLVLTLTLTIELTLTLTLKVEPKCGLMCLKEMSVAY